MIIDVHTHMIPEHFPPVNGRKAGTRWPVVQHIEGERAEVLFEGKNVRTILSSCWDVSRRLAEMPEQGVDRQVLSPSPRLLRWELDSDDALDLSRCLNEDIARMIDSAPDRFFGLGAVPLQEDIEASTRELTRLKELGLRGVEVLTNINGKNLADGMFRPFLKEVETLGLCILSHPYTPTFMDRLVGEPAENSVGFPIENALAAAAMITSGALEECPNLRICFSHGGGPFTHLLPRMQHAWDENEGLRTQLPDSPTIYAQRCYYDDILFDKRALRYLIEMVGVSQVLVGSDYPFGGNWRYKVKPEDEFAQLGLTDEECEAVGYANCLRFLGIGKG